MADNVDYDDDDDAGCSSSSGIESVSPEARLADQQGRPGVNILRPGVNILLLLIIFIIILGSIRSIKVVVICPRISLFAKMESLPNYSTLSLVLCSALHSLPPSSNFWTNLPPNLPPQSGESAPHPPNETPTTAMMRHNNSRHTLSGMSNKFKSHLLQS